MPEFRGVVKRIKIFDMRKKRTAPVILLLSALLSFELFSLNLAYSHRRNPPAQLSFQQFRVERVQIFTPAEGPVARNPSAKTEITQNLLAAEQQLGLSLPEWNVYVYNNWEEKGQHVEDIRIAHVNTKRSSLHYILNRDWNGAAERKEFALLMSHKYGPPAHEDFAAAISAAFADVWNQKKLDDWIPFLLDRNLPPRIPEYFTDRQVSYLARIPWIAVFFRFVKEHYGLNELIHLYKTGELPVGYQTSWNALIASGRTGALKKNLTFRSEFQKGISYAYSNSFDGGYATKKSAASLDRLKKLGTNWVAAIPYGFMRQNDSTTVRLMGHSIVGESDESMIALLADARDREMKVMLKPQIWIDHDSWPGNVDFPTEQLWSEWFHNYGNWIIHYALLAELHQIDLFCIGTEFVQATLKHPEKWRALIQRIREVYSGPLVYAANCGREFEGITFWDALDYLGLDNYYSVRISEDDGPDRLRESFQKQKEKLKLFAVRYKKPLIFTEVGYMANEKAGMGSQEYSGAKYDERGQELCYRLLMETYWNESWFAGMYWWKWFSDPTDRGRNADAHSPHGRLAENVLAEFYSKESR